MEITKGSVSKSQFNNFKDPNFLNFEKPDAQLLIVFHFFHCVASEYFSTASIQLLHHQHQHFYKVVLRYLV